MAKIREVVCVHYQCEGECDVGRGGTFYKSCQTCGEYCKKPGARPARTDNRKHKLERIREKELRVNE